MVDPRDLLVALHLLLCYVVSHRVLRDARKTPPHMPPPPRAASAAAPRARAARMAMHRGHAWVLVVYTVASLSSILWAVVRQKELSATLLMMRACMLGLWMTMLTQQQLGSLNPLRRGLYGAPVQLDLLSRMLKVGRGV